MRIDITNDCNNMLRVFGLILLFKYLFFGSLFGQPTNKSVSPGKMQAIYEEIKTPFKYGMVLVPGNDSEKIDCPTIVRKGDTWYMSYIIF